MCTVPSSAGGCVSQDTLQGCGVGSWRRELRGPGEAGQPGVEQGGQRTRGIQARLGSGARTALGFRRRVGGPSRLCPPSLPL